MRCPWCNGTGEGKPPRLPDGTETDVNEEGERMDKQRKTAAELEEIVKVRIGAGDFRVTVHRNPEAGWHATVYGRQPAEVHRCQVMADTIVAELCRHYELAD